MHLGHLSYRIPVIWDAAAAARLDLEFRFDDYRPDRISRLIRHPRSVGSRWDLVGNIVSRGRQFSCTDPPLIRLTPEEWLET
jgi:hypothetical protein